MDYSDCIVFSTLSVSLSKKRPVGGGDHCAVHFSLGVLLTLADVGVGDHCATVPHYWHVLIAWPSTFCLAVWMYDLCPRSLLMPFFHLYFKRVILGLGTISMCWWCCAPNLLHCSALLSFTCWPIEQDPVGLLSKTVVLPTLQPSACAVWLGWVCCFVLVWPITGLNVMLSCQSHSRGLHFSRPVRGWSLCETE